MAALNKVKHSRLQDITGYKENRDIEVLNPFIQDAALTQLANVTGRNDYAGELWEITHPVVIYGFYAML